MASKYNPVPAKIVSLLIFTIIIIASCLALYPRVMVERDNTSIEIFADYRDVAMLAQNTKKDAEEVLKYLVDCGITGMMVSELTGELLSSGGLPVFYGAAGAIEETRFEGHKGSLIVIPDELPYAKDLLELLDIRFHGEHIQLPQSVGVLLPFSNKDMEKFGVVPDLEGLYAANKIGLPVFWRVAQALNGETQDALNMLSAILEKFKNISVVAPFGDIALGFPDMSQFAGVLKANKVPAAQIEFSRQLGAPAISSLMFPDIIPLHSVTQEEITSRNLTRLALYERLIRAATERSVRMLMFRPAQSGASSDPLIEFGEEIKKLKDGLTARGLFVKKTANVYGGVRWNNSIYGVLACGLMFLYTLFSYYIRFNSGGEDVKISVKHTAAFILCAAFVLPAMFYSQRVSVLVGALVSVLIVVEASIVAMNPKRANFYSMLEGFVIAVMGGLSIAALFSEPLYMLRIRAFSGVKMTLMLPPVLVLLYDLHRRIHPESLRETLSRPPLWGELMLAGVLLAGAGIILFRSDNVRVVPGLEARAREFLERTLVARPRNKEILLGFPCLIFYYYAMRKGMWPHYREVLRLGVVMGFSSVVNSFCHFHTPLFFILIRQFNGLWVGVAIGILSVAVYNFCLMPLYNRFKSAFD
ncbi:MAG: DUF5693 family protein [Synergistaceae bacterium]|nr:DUF5693 family protein [Synergistaceae bacterium]